jgi:phosphoglycolate phosphatase
MNILLDLNGTLTDPRQGIVGCIKHALNGLALRCPSDAELARYIGPPLQETFGELMGSTDPARIDAAVALYRERFAVTGMFENTVYPGVPAALAALKTLGAVLYVATSKPAVYAVRIVEHFGLDEFIHTVYGSELDGTRSNKAQLIAHILTTESLSPGSTYMVGDRLHDVVGAKANGVFPVGVLWGYGSREELVTAGAAVLCESPATLCAALQRAAR